MQKPKGFTIVELLIVIVVIGILAALVMASFSGAQERARQAKIENDLSSLEKAVMVARINTGLLLSGVTNDEWTADYCSYPTGLDLATIPKTHGCWVDYIAAIDKIAAAAKMNLDELKKGDPRGIPYYIDENEGEHGVDGCDAEDELGTYTNPVPANLWDPDGDGQYIGYQNWRTVTFFTCTKD